MHLQGNKGMKIAIYIDNKNINNIDCSDLKRGNPGIGGTEYCILLFAQLYKEYYPLNQVILIASSNGTLPVVDDVIIEKNILSIPRSAAKLNSDILLISSVFEGQPLPNQFFHLIDQKKIKTITWGHNYYLSNFCNQIVKSKFVRANVFVGHQQYDRYLDHKIIFKSTYIYNMYPVVNEPLRNKNDGKTVTYIGSLVPTKGFHLLANAWKTVLTEVPNAELHVIGSGKLYDRTSKLGKYEIAEEKYENSFINAITENGKLLKSVFFHGVLGEEKNNLISETSVGVANPSGRTETFGISALDFSARCVPVVTIASGGFLDTVINNSTGLLYNTSSELAKYIIRLLKNTEMNEKFGQNGRNYSYQFEPNKLIIKWDELFKKVNEDIELKIEMPSNFVNNNLKKIRIINRRIKQFLNIEYPISVIGIETFGKFLIRRIKH